MISTITEPAIAAPYRWDLNLPQVRSADACRAIGCNSQWLRNMVSRTPPVVLLRDDERVDVGERQYLQFTIRSVIHLALVCQLTETYTPRRAHEYAAAFTYFGGEAGGPPRDPADLFYSGHTLLFVDPTREHGVVVAADPKDSWVTVFAQGTQGVRTIAPIAVMSMNLLVGHVRAELGV